MFSSDRLSAEIDDDVNRVLIYNMYVFSNINTLKKHIFLLQASSTK